MKSLVLMFLVVVSQCTASESMRMEQLPDRPWATDSLYLSEDPEFDPQFFEDTAFIRYTALLYRTLEMDTTVDFARMRFWYTHTLKFDPYGLQTDNKVPAQSDSMTQAWHEENWARALEFAQEITVREMCNIDAHAIAFRAALKLGDSSQAAFHQWMTYSLLESIDRSGDGLSPESAFEVISIKEERPLLAYLGYTFEKQALITKDGRSFDLITAVKIDGDEETEFWFDVSIPFSRGMNISEAAKDEFLRNVKEIQDSLDGGR